jgi:hypothetical protein
MLAIISELLMDVIRRIVFTDGHRPCMLRRMITQPTLAFDNPWLLWRADAPAEPQILTVAELAECACPDLCDRDHDND